MAGVRPAEASTVATLAMHHTLSWLLYMSAGAVMAGFPICAGAKVSQSDKTAGKWSDVEGKLFNGLVIYIEGETWGLQGEAHDRGTFWATAVSDTQKRLFHKLPEGSLVTYTATWQDGSLQIACAEEGQLDTDCDATWTLRRCGQAEDVPVISVKPTDVQDMLPLLRSLIPASEALCGVNKHGVAQKHVSEVREEVLKVGAYLASYLLEGWYSILLSAIYVYITVTIGFPIVGAAWDVVVNVAELDDGDYWVIALGYVVGHVDAHIYVFMGAILMTIHRYFTGRRLFTRFCARNVVIVESTANYKLLRAYVSKLRALAFRFTTFGVAGQNGADHFVHEMTHLTTSETIILAGRPDGRIGSLAATEAANIMSLQQARYIAASPYTGVECISVGHNPWAKPGLFSRTVTLPTEHRPRFFTSELLNSTHGAHAPTDIMYGVATLARGDAAKASDRTTDAPFSWVRIEDISSRMSNRKQVGLAHAQNIIEDLVVEYADDLQINAANFHAQSVLTAESAAILCGSRSLPSQATIASKGSIRHGMSGLVAMVSGPTKEKFLVPGSEAICSVSGVRTWSSTSYQTVMLSASNIMATLRGRKMEDTIKRLRNDARVVGQESWMRSDQLFQIKHAILHAWALWALQRNRDREVGRVSEILRQESDANHAGLPQVFAWRMREEYRRRRRQWMFDVSELSTSGPLSVSRCLRAWKDAVAESRRLAKQQAISAFSPNKSLHQATEMLRQVSPTKTQVNELIRKHSPVKGYAATEATAKVAIKTLVSRVKIPEVVIGQHCRAAVARSDVQGKNVLVDLRTMETLYETRIASAERLLAFFILFHAAVRPISRLWGLAFDMDRSESRLRVASTPAPVPFVEGGHDAVDSRMDALSIASTEETPIEV